MSAAIGALRGLHNTAWGLLEQLRIRLSRHKVWAEQAMRVVLRVLPRAEGIP